MAATTTVILGLYVLLLGVAAVSDLVRFTIPNWVCGALAVLVMPAMIAAPGAHNWFGHIGAAGAALVAGAAAFRFAGVGGGDVKLFTGLALWAGFDRLLDLMTGIVLAGGVLALVLVVLRRLAGIVVPAQPGRPSRLPRLFWIGEGVPYGVALAAGGLWQAPTLPAFAGLS
jgi:prepilin peptidase CpaA